MNEVLKRDCDFGVIMHGGKRDGAGRKSARIDLAELEKLCALQCTDEDVAAFFGVTVRMIERRRQKPAFAAVMESGRAKGRLSVRRSLFAQASNGNTAASIFLAKNLRRQSGRQDRGWCIRNDLPFDGPLSDLVGGPAI